MSVANESNSNWKEIENNCLISVIPKKKLACEFKHRWNALINKMANVTFIETFCTNSSDDSMEEGEEKEKRVVEGNELEVR